MAGEKMKNIFSLDKGMDFGKWNDKVSKTIYSESIGSLKRYDFSNQRVADYGGGNGLLKKEIGGNDWIVIDCDSSKSPDIVDNIVTHSGDYDVVVLRMVLHYLSDSEIEEMISRIQKNGVKEIHLLQFWSERGEDLLIKKTISKLFEEPTEGKKFFRTKEEILSFFSEFSVEEVGFSRYVVSGEFYRNRFSNPTIPDVPHKETLTHFYINLVKKRKEK